MTPTSPTGVRIEAIETFAVAPRWILVRVRASDGTEGWGEAIVPKRRRAVTGAVADLADNIVGEPADHIEDLTWRMRNGAFFRGGPILETAAAAVEQALWDIKARRLGVPVHDLLGGAVRTTVRAYAWVGGDRPRDLVEHTRARQAQGFDMVKLNATEELDLIESAHQLDAVVTRVAELRDAVGNDVDIALDFHGRVHRAVARALIRELDQFGLMWIEEPLPPGHEDAYPAVIPPDRSTPIATGERLTSRMAMRGLLADGVVDVLQPDVSQTGIGELLAIARMAEAYDVAVAPHCPNGPVSLAASLQVASASRNVPVLEQSVGLHYNQGYGGLPTGEIFDYLTDPAPLRTQAGRFAVPQGPGLGIEMDTDAVTGSPPWSLRDPVWRLPDGRSAEW